MSSGARLARSGTQQLPRQLSTGRVTTAPKPLAHCAQLGALRGPKSQSFSAIQTGASSTAANALRSSPNSRAIMASAASDAVETVWALDFDGMLCDSVGESALTAWKAGVQLWPEIFTTDEAEAKKDGVIEGMRQARPVIETGYENIPMVRALLEGDSASDMLENWGTILPDLMSKYNLDRAEMVDLFGNTRDGWIKEDLQGWLAPNRFYPGIVEATEIAMKNPKGIIYIVTTKQARFTETLLNMAGIPFPLERIYSQTVSGKPKSEVLEMLHQKHPNASYHFVEDKMGTLEKMEKQEIMDPWNLYLVDWGYNTDIERQRAKESPRMSLIGPDEYRDLMSL